jgi:hypothetical protein
MQTWAVDVPCCNKQVTAPVHLWWVEEELLHSVYFARIINSPFYSEALLELPTLHPSHDSWVPGWVAVLARLQGEEMKLVRHTAPLNFSLGTHFFCMRLKFTVFFGTSPLFCGWHVGTSPLFSSWYVGIPPYSVLLHYSPVDISALPRYSPVDMLVLPH